MSKPEKTPKTKAVAFKPFVFTNCQECGQSGAFWRFWAQKRLCSNCAAKSITIYIRSIVAVLAIVAALAFI